MGGGSPLYPSHLPLSQLQHGAVAVLSSIGALLRPQRADLVAAVGETTGLYAVKLLYTRMKQDAVGQRILAERPRITDASTSHCWSLPSHTFGGAYAKFMGSRGFHADDRPPVRFVQDEELAYVLTRMREVHDFWHVLFDCHTNVFGELALKAVEFVQTGVPMTGLAVLGAQYRLKPADRQLLQETFMPWAVRAGTRSRDLMNIYYEENFQEDLEDMRRRYNILPAPPVPLHLANKRAATEVHSA
ncbi:ubiquinone biosynthesis protein [Haematococcus lacustris]